MLQQGMWWDLCLWGFVITKEVSSYSTFRKTCGRLFQLHVLFKLCILIKIFCHLLHLQGHNTQPKLLLVWCQFLCMDGISRKFLHTLSRCPRCCILFCRCCCIRIWKLRVHADFGCMMNLFVDESYWLGPLWKRGTARFERIVECWIALQNWFMVECCRCYLHVDAPCVDHNAYVPGTSIKGGNRGIVIVSTPSHLACFAFNRDIAIAWFALHWGGKYPQFGFSCDGSPPVFTSCCSWVLASLIADGVHCESNNFFASFSTIFLGNIFLRLLKQYFLLCKNRIVFLSFWLL